MVLNSQRIKDRWPRFWLPVVLLRSAATPLAVLSPPVVLFRSALTPLAVLPPPVVLLPSAARLRRPYWNYRWCCQKRANASPLAVLLLPVVLFKKGERSVGRVVIARGVVQKRSSPSGGILICGVEKKRSRPDTGIET